MGNIPCCQTVDRKSVSPSFSLPPATATGPKMLDEEFNNEFILDNVPTSPINVFPTKLNLISNLCTIKVKIEEPVIEHHKKPSKSKFSPAGTQTGGMQKIPEESEDSTPDQSCVKIERNDKTFSDGSVMEEKQKCQTIIPIDPSKFRIERKTTLEDNYEVLYILGKGTFGEVRMVKHKKSGQKRALKIVAKSACQMSENYVDEIEILKNLVF